MTELTISAPQLEEGNSVPDVVFKVRVRDASIGGDNPFKWVDMKSADYFAGKRVLVFSLPGAFTPTCSTYQVPGFEEAYTEITEDYDIDEIYVLSVNDTFVMRCWMIDQNIENLKYIPDGNGEFTYKMGMLVDKSNLGFAFRSWRYAMVVDNGVIEKLFVEPGKTHCAEEDPYGETSPENVINYLVSKTIPV